MRARRRFVLFDWGDTLMSEDGPQERPMADWPEVRAVAGAPEIVAHLAGRYTLAVCTNATVSKRADVARALERVGLARYFTQIFCYTEIGRRKDEPEFWSIALARLGAQVDECVMVGDSLEQDVLGPQRAGIAAIWFNWKGAPHPATLAHPVISALAELPSLLDVAGSPDDFETT